MSAKMKPILVVVNGLPRSGKDSFVNYCVDNLKNRGDQGIKYSTVDTVKEIATMMGWDGEKDVKSRVMLSELKDLFTRHFDGTFNEMIDMLHSIENDPSDDGFVRFGVLFSMIREPSEITKITNHCIEKGIRCFSVLMTGRGEENHVSHSDTEVFKFDYTHEIDNAGTMHELNIESLNFIREITT